MDRSRNDTGQTFVESVKKAAFIIGSVLLVFVAARNSVTWFRFLGASGDFWQNTWNKVYDAFGENEFMLAIVGTNLWVMSVFWLLNASFLVIELTGWPKFVKNYKVQENYQATLYDVTKAAKRVLFNQTVVSIPMGLVYYYMMLWRGCSFGRELPTFSWVVWQFFVFIWVEELGFYYSHRFLHHPAVYKHVHKVHHEFTAPISIVSFYAHPIEHILSNTTPVTLGPLLCGSHVATMWLWYALGLFSITVAHCGYHFPLLPSPEAHDFHHLKFTNNFGTLGVLDRLHGTDHMFRKSKAYERHFLSLSLVPVKALHPQDTKKN